MTVHVIVSKSLLSLVLLRLFLLKFFDGRNEETCRVFRKYVTVFYLFKVDFFVVSVNRRNKLLPGRYSGRIKEYGYL